jgi:WxL domain surface cell wall-binding
MTVPAGTAGSPTVGTVTPAAMATAGTVTLAGGVLTLSFTATAVSGGQAVSIQINGLTNTPTPGSFSSNLTIFNGASAVDSGVTPAITITPGVLVSPTWSVSSSTAAATGVSYTYTFTTPSTSTLSSVTMTVPAGTAGSPTVGTVTPAAMATAGTVTLVGGVLTLSFTATAVSAGQAVSIQINGLTNTPTPGSYSSTLTTKNGSLSVDLGITPAVTISLGTLSLTAPASFTWTLLLNGAVQSVVDPLPADQQLTVNDNTGSGAGWNVMVSATTFTNGSNTLPNLGTFKANGSLASPTALNAPTATCVASCTLPTNSVSSYPVAITTAASSPAPVKIYGAMAGTGLGPIVIGGSTAANPLGWWLSVPATAKSGAYTSTVTVSVGSGP